MHPSASQMMETKKGVMMKRRSSMMKTKKEKGAKTMTDLMDPIGLNLLNAGASSVTDVIATAAPKGIQELIWEGMNLLPLVCIKGAYAPNADLHNPVEDDDAWWS